MLMSMRAVMKWTLFHFLVSSWLHIDYKTRWTIVGSFLSMMRIQKLVIFFAQEGRISWAVIHLLGNISHVIMFIVLCYNTNRSTSWWEINMDFKHIIFYKGMIWEVNFNVGKLEVFLPSMSSEPGEHLLTNILLCSSKIS